MAIVYLVHDHKHERRVALKAIRPDLANLLGPDRFLREIRLVAQLQHPHILPVFDSGEAAGLLWYTMPYVEGESLRDRLRHHSQLTVADALRITRQVAEALDYSHRHDVVHRDIKPENILLDQDEHALLADFGIARVSRAAEPSLTEAGLTLGTPAYMSPEQALGESTVDGRSDVYALGCVLFEMLAGAPPFTGFSPQEVLGRRLSEPVPRISATRRDAGPEIDAVIDKALARIPEDRFATAAEFAGALPSIAPGNSGIRLRPRRLWFTAATVMIATIAAVVLWGHGGSKGQLSINPELVAVLPFRVEGADPSLHFLRQGMIDLMTSKLTGEGGPRAADPRSVLAASRSVTGGTDQDLTEPLAMSVAQRLGAGQILQGSVVGSPDHLVISATLVHTGKRVSRQVSVQGPRDSLFQLIDRLTAELLAMGAGLGAQELSSVTTTSLEALRVYLDGQAAYRRAAFTEAAQFFDRALQIDSTFALAAYGLMLAGGWGEGHPNERKAERLAWRYRERLSERDKLLLSVRLGPLYPVWSPDYVLIPAYERLTRLMPESPDVWFELGDILFHRGLLGGMADARYRAEIFLRRALDRDSVFAPALTHLLALVHERGDTTEIRRVGARLLAVESKGWVSWAVRWRLAGIRADERELARLIAELDSADASTIANSASIALMDSTGLDHLDSFLRLAQSHATTTDERAGAAWLAWTYTINRGRPGEARLWIDSLEPGSRGNYMVLGWLAGADTNGIEQAGLKLNSLSASPPGHYWQSPVFLREAVKLLRGDISSSDRVVRQLRTDSALADSIRQHHLVGAQLLEAWTAVLRSSPQARRLLEVADSMLVGRMSGVIWEWFNPLIAHLYARIGATDRALAAIRRRYYVGSSFFPVGLAETSRFEGLWAAQTGDREGAKRAYRRYLMFRRNPEPSKVPQRDSVVRELSELK